MTKINRIILFILLCVLSINVVYAKEANIGISKIELYDKSENTVINQKPSASGLTVNSDVSFYHVGDYVKYKIVIKNHDDEDYDIDKIQDLGDKSKYTIYEYTLSNKKTKS